jgi:hypothetical protein
MTRADRCAQIAGPVSARRMGAVIVAGASAERSKRQEHSRMIRSAIGRPTPTALAIVNANAKTKFGSACIGRPDMPLLHRAPTGIARRPRINDKKAGVGTSSTHTQRLPRPKQPEPERFAVKKRLTRWCPLFRFSTPPMADNTSASVAARSGGDIELPCPR